MGVGMAELVLAKENEAAWPDQISHRKPTALIEAINKGGQGNNFGRSKADTSARLQRSIPREVIPAQ